MSALSWGPSDNSLKTDYPQIDIVGNKVCCGRVVLQNFPSDCGALILTSANQADFESLKLAAKVASSTGFNKIFATVVTIPSCAENIVKEFRKAKWRCVSKGMSNRNEHKESYVFVKIIKDCQYKGY